MIGILLITIFALLIGIILTVLDQKEPSRKEEYLKRLPGFNCGGCGNGRIFRWKKSLIYVKK